MSDKSKENARRPFIVPEKKGYQPSGGLGDVKGGYQPTNQESAPANPPSKGSGVKKK